MKLYLIFASSANHVIGKDNTLPWSVPEDLKMFKKITTSGKHNVVLMGKNTFNSIGRPLPGRENVVLTTDKEFSVENVVVQHSIDSAIEYLETKEKELGEELDVFIIGGQKVYEQFINHPKLTRVYHTLVDETVDGDTFFNPDFSKFFLIKNEQNYSVNNFTRFYFREYEKTIEIDGNLFVVSKEPIKEGDELTCIATSQFSDNAEVQTKYGDKGTVELSFDRVNFQNGESFVYWSELFKKLEPATN